MKNKLTLILFCGLLYHANSYSQSVGIGTPTPHAGAQLDITSNSKGLLIPRLTNAQRTAIVNPPKGLIVYDSTSHLIFYHNGTSWQNLSPASNTWSLNGNAGTNPLQDFIGTTDNMPLVFRTNNIR